MESSISSSSAPSSSALQVATLTKLRLMPPRLSAAATVAVLLVVPSKRFVDQLSQASARIGGGALLVAVAVFFFAGVFDVCKILCPYPCVCVRDRFVAALV
jgi:hypothetical protein